MTPRGRTPQCNNNCSRGHNLLSSASVFDLDSASVCRSSLVLPRVGSFHHRKPVSHVKLSFSLSLYLSCLMIDFMLDWQQAGLFAGSSSVDTHQNFFRNFLVQF